jgi:hypothetical protein
MCRLLIKFHGSYRVHRVERERGKRKGINERCKRQCKNKNIYRYEIWKCPDNSIN